MKLADFFSFDATIPQLQGLRRDEVIAELVAALDKTGVFGKDDCRRLTRAVIKRENEASTGMGKGIAVPHVKHAAVTEVVAAIGKSMTGIDFSALDKLPVHSVVLLISPADDPDKHLHAMENLFKHLQNEKFRRFLNQAGTAEQIEELIRDADVDPTL